MLLFFNSKQHQDEPMILFLPFCTQTYTRKQTQRLNKTAKKKNKFKIRTNFSHYPMNFAPVSVSGKTDTAAAWTERLPATSLATQVIRVWFLNQRRDASARDGWPVGGRDGRQNHVMYNGVSPRGKKMNMSLSEVLEAWVGTTELTKGSFKYLTQARTSTWDKSVLRSAKHTQWCRSTLCSELFPKLEVRFSEVQTKRSLFGC